MTDRLARLAELATLTAEMCVAAEARDGDRLSVLDEKYQAASAALLALPLATPDDPDAAHVVELGAQILERQRAFEETVRPWMDDLRTLLRERRNEQALANTYRPTG